MKKSSFTEEQVSYALRQTESGTPVADICRQLGVSQGSFCVWHNKYGNLNLTELCELRRLGDKSARVNRVVADLTPDKHILGELVRKKL